MQGRAYRPGRKGRVSIAHGIRDSLHVRLAAPFEWRVENVMRKKEMGKDTAQKFVTDTDEKGMT
jgi:hypothetical protein